MFQRIYNISIFSSRIYMKFHAIFALYLDVDAYISLINICSHFFQSRNKNFLEWEETLFSLHSHLKNINLNAWADLVRFMPPSPGKFIRRSWTPGRSPANKISLRTQPLVVISGSAHAISADKISWR